MTFVRQPRNLFACFSKLQAAVLLLCVLLQHIGHRQYKLILAVSQSIKFVFAFVFTSFGAVSMYVEGSIEKE